MPQNVSEARAASPRDNQAARVRRPPGPVRSLAARQSGQAWIQRTRCLDDTTKIVLRALREELRLPWRARRDVSPANSTAQRPSRRIALPIRSIHPRSRRQKGADSRGILSRPQRSAAASTPGGSHIPAPGPRPTCPPSSRQLDEGRRAPLPGPPRRLLPTRVERTEAYERCYWWAA